jgi:hypothetical protein
MPPRSNAVPPDLALADGGKIIECQLEDDRQRWQVMGPKFYATMRYVNDVAATRAALTFEERQRAANGAYSRS